MSEWVVYGKDGLTEKCRLKSVEYSGSFLNERAVSATIENHSKIQFEVFDYIEYRGERFELESIPTVKKTSSFSYEYELRFVSYKYELERCEMRDIVPNDNRVVYPTPLSFSFTGDVRYLVERIQACLDELYGKDVWKLSVADDVVSEEKNITIAQQNCWNALALVNTTYGLNFYIKGRNITIGGSQPILSHTFQYGKGNGLYEIERTSDTDTAIVTKLRAYGSERNLDYSYPKKPEWSDSALDTSFVLSPLRLMLPSFKKDGKTDYILADEATIAEYGIREASVIYDDIYPTITGVKNLQGQAIDEIKAVEAVDDTKSTFVIHLHDLGFDLESHLTTADAQISMKSGAMQGYTFNISAIEKQEDNSYKITLGRITTDTSDTGNYEIPNSSWNMAAGDKFVLLNILMPQEYIREAENRLLERAKEYLSEYGKTNFSYNVGLHDKFLVENSDVYSSLVEGAKLTIHDEVLGISEDVTIQSITITENAEDNILPQVKITLNNNPSASTLDRIQGQIKELSETASGTFSSQSELLKQYRKKLDKPFFDRLFVAVGLDGKELASTDTTSPIAYIKAKYSFATIGGITMYAQDGNIYIPTIAEGLPFDNRTIWFNPNTKRIEVIGGTGGGSGEGVSNFWDLSGIPSWITNTKPTYSYSEIQGTPDLSVYALKSDIPSLSGYATEQWVLGKGYALSSDLSKYIPIAGATDITGEKNFTGGLKVNGSPIYYDEEKKYWKLEGDLLVTGGVTMYGNDSEFVASTIMDAILYDSNTLGINSSGQLYVKGSVGGATTLGSLANVGSWADSVAPQDRIMYQAANSSQWVAKNLSDLAVGGVTGDYLPLSGGTINGSGDYLYVPLYINALNNQISGITFKTNGAERGHVGYSSGLGIRLHSSTAAGISVSDSDTPIFYTADGAIKNTIWHAGNDGSGSGLDADLLDGKHYSDIINGNVASATRLQAYQHNSGENKLISGTRTDNTFPRYIYDNGWGLCLRWQEGNGVVHNGTIATLNDNVASATKLQTPRTIWGQSFDGTGDITGKLTFSELNGNIPAIQFKNGEVIDAYGNIQMYSTTNTWSIELNYSPLFCVTGSGNVGMGITSPLSKCDINGLLTIRNESSTSKQSSLNLMNTSSDLWQLSARYGTSENGNLNIYYYNGSTWATPLSINKSGNILVSGGITMYSARKLKNITDERGLSLEELSTIKPTRFTWKDGRDNRLHIGGIADDVMKVLPEVIYKTGEDDTLTMDYGNAAFAIAASLIKPVVNHEERIKVLEEENKRLKEEVEQLKWNIA